MSAPALKFTIGIIASLCAVLLPRMLAALTLRDNQSLGFIDQSFIEVAVAFSVLVGLAVMSFEWQVPRKPRDTFMATLGIPAILAGAVSGNQNAQLLQQQVQRENELSRAIGEKSGIAIESTERAIPKHQSSHRPIDLMTPVYAESRSLSGSVTEQPPLAIRIRQPRYFIVLDRSQTLQGAEAKRSQLSQRFKAATPDRTVSLDVQNQGTEFFVIVAGGPRIKAEAMLEAVRLKDTYHVNPILVEARTKDRT